MGAASSAESILRQAGELPDEAIDIAGVALALAALDRPEVDLAPYRAHLSDLVRDVGDAMQAGAGDRATMLRAVLTERHGYTGDRETYNAIDNANLMRVIDRRRGLPVALSILWLHAARGQGWPAHGLNFPGHFIIRVDDGTDRVIVDPFNGGAVLKPEDLRRILTAVVGRNAELQPAHCATVGNRAVLLRLQNNIKLRLLQARRLQGALTVVERMILVAPREPGLWHEAGALHRELGNLKTAISCLEHAMALAGDDMTRHGVALELQELRARLH